MTLDFLSCTFNTLYSELLRFLRIFWLADMESYLSPAGVDETVSSSITCVSVIFREIFIPNFHIFVFWLHIKIFIHLDDIDFSQTDSEWGLCNNPINSMCFKNTLTDLCIYD